MSMLNTIWHVAQDVLTPPADIIPPSYAQLATSPLDLTLSGHGQRDDSAMLPQPRLDLVPLDVAAQYNAAIHPDSRPSDPISSLTPSDQRKLTQFATYMHQLQQLNDDAFLSAYPALPSRDIVLSPFLIQQLQQQQQQQQQQHQSNVAGTSHISSSPSPPGSSFNQPNRGDLQALQRHTYDASFPYSPTNDFDLGRNAFTRDTSQSRSAFGTSFTWTAISPSNDNLTSLRYQQRQVIQLEHHDYLLKQQQQQQNPLQMPLEPMTTTTTSASTTPISAHTPPPPHVSNPSLLTQPTTLLADGLNAIGLLPPIFRGFASQPSPPSNVQPNTSPSTPTSINSSPTIPSQHVYSPNLAALDLSVVPQPDYFFDNVGGSIFSPTIVHPHLFSVTVGSALSTGAHLDMTAAIKGRAIVHVAARQSPQYGGLSLLHSSTASGSGSNIASSSLATSSLSSLSSPGITSDNFNLSSTSSSFSSPEPSVDIQVLTQAGPVAASARLFDVNSSGPAEVCLSSHLYAFRHHFELTLQSRPTYIFAQTDTSTQRVVHNVGLDTLHSSDAALHSSDGNGTRSFESDLFHAMQPSSSVATATSGLNASLNHNGSSSLLSATSVNPLAAGLGSESVAHIHRDLASWHLQHAVPQTNTRSELSSKGSSSDNPPLGLNLTPTSSYQLSPHERAILDKPVIHLGVTRATKPWLRRTLIKFFAMLSSPTEFFSHVQEGLTQPSHVLQPSSSQQPYLSVEEAEIARTRAWFGLRWSVHSFYPRWLQYKRQLEDSHAKQQQQQQNQTKNQETAQPLNAAALPPGPAPTPQTPEGAAVPGSAAPAVGPDTGMSFPLVPHASFSHLLHSLGLAYTEQGPHHHFNVEVTDTGRAARAVYTHKFNSIGAPPMLENDEQQQNTATTRGYTRPVGTETFPQLSTSVGLEVNLSQLRASQIAIYDQLHYANERARLEQLREQTVQFLESVSSEPRTPVVEQSAYRQHQQQQQQQQHHHQQQQPQQQSVHSTPITKPASNAKKALPLPAIAQTTSHAYILSPLAIRSLASALTSQLARTYHATAAVNVRFSPTTSASILTTSRGHLALEANIASAPSPLLKCGQQTICGKCHLRRCSCYDQSHDFFGLPMAMRLTLQTPLFSMRPIQDASVGVNISLGDY